MKDILLYLSIWIVPVLVNEAVEAALYSIGPRLRSVTSPRCSLVDSCSGSAQVQQPVIRLRSWDSRVSAAAWVLNRIFIDLYWSFPLFLDWLTQWRRCPSSQEWNTPKLCCRRLWWGGWTSPLLSLGFTSRKAPITASLPKRHLPKCTFLFLFFCLKITRMSCIIWHNESMEPAVRKSSVSLQVKLRVEVFRSFTQTKVAAPQCKYTFY